MPALPKLDRLLESRLARIAALAGVVALLAIAGPAGGEGLRAGPGQRPAALPAAAGQGALVGIGDEHAAMFSSPYFRVLHLRTARLIVSWDVAIRPTRELANVDAWMLAARDAHVEPLVTFSFTKGCYDARGHVPKAAKCRLPSVGTYVRAFTAFRERYPDVRVYSPWNEINHRSQPTYKNPRRAAQFYNAVRSRCAGCTIVAADVLDQPHFVEYLKQFRRYAKGNPSLWGLHNYQDTNNHTQKGTKAMLAAVHGQIWLTETGGIVKFLHRPFNPGRAAQATEFMFRLARLSSRISRIYVYQWTGARFSDRFDAGITGPDGRPRPAYYVVKRHLPKTPSPDLTDGAGNQSPTGPSGPSGSGPTGAPPGGGGPPSGGGSGGGAGAPPSSSPCPVPTPLPCPPMGVSRR